MIAGTWDEDAGRWVLETSKGRLTAQVVVLGVGALSEPSIPRIPGLETLFVHRAEVHSQRQAERQPVHPPAHQLRPTTLKVTYVSAPAASASGSFTPTGCDALPYSPALSASVVKDRRDNGVTVVTTVSQAADEAATKATTLTIPPAVAGPNGLVAIKEVNSPVPVG